MEYIDRIWASIMPSESLNYQEVVAWQTVNGCRLLPWEVELIITADRAYRGALNE